ncbi:MAG: hypothetical protein U0T69_00025 [Chitinophagales bacterium]
MMKQLILIFLVLTIYNLTFGQVQNTSYQDPNGEKILQLSIIVPIVKCEAWKLFSTDNGLVKWIAPVAKIELETGGSIKTNYDKEKGPDDKSAIRLDIINYLTDELMTLKVNLNNSFPKEVQQEDKNLQEIIQFIDIGNEQTKIISSMVGWGKGEQWDKTYNFFEKGNIWTYEQVLKIFDQK